MHKDILVVAWNGKDTPLSYIQFDQEPRFQLWLFNYSGNQATPVLPAEKKVDGVFSYQTEFKGQLLERLCEAVLTFDYRYIGIMDDDHEISVAGINRLLEIAEQENADSFQPSITHNSYYSHKCFLQKPGAAPEEMCWLEIMAPFMRKKIFEAAQPFYPGVISSYGIDRYVYPYLQRKMGLNKKLLIHEVALRHIKPVTPGSRVLSSGLDALQECELVRKDILNRIKKEKLHFTKREMWVIFECWKPRIFKWRDDLVRTWRIITGTRQKLKL